MLPDGYDEVLGTGYKVHQLRTTELECRVHKIHYPRPHVVHIHHIWPLGYHGPDSRENQIPACPTGHYNAHKILSYWVKNNTPPLWVELRRYTKGEVALARQGFLCIRASAVLVPFWTPDLGVSK